MTKEQLRRLLISYKQGRITADEAVSRIAGEAHESLGFATIDHHRELRQGFPEVILCEGKSPTQVAAIAKQIVAHGSLLFATRARFEHFTAIRRAVKRARYNEVARTIAAREELITHRGVGTILVVSAGTSDIPVAEEAVETSRIMGNDVDRLYDVGVAGIHRLLGSSDKLHKASVIIVVAGMEGALASVVGGLVDVPVIAVPTSVGYGASFGGLAPLLGMLNSCAAGVTVVNIDNGFGAGFAASVINRQREHVDGRNSPS
ncbi:MAG: nickel pincer cofactor biosynthesis protein LarB [Bacteroidota bacterium]